jgi:hypothetical protein
MPPCMNTMMHYGGRVGFGGTHYWVEVGMALSAGYNEWLPWGNLFSRVFFFFSTAAHYWGREAATYK